MRTRTSIVLAVTLLCVAAMAVPAGVTASTDTVQAVEHTQDDEFIQECAAEPPADLEDPDEGNEVIGWVDGYWYNEPLSINVTGGLSEAELDRLTARTTARFEVMRCLAAVDGAPPVQIQSREQFQEQQEGLFQDVSEKWRLANDAQFEAMLVISSEQNSTDVREENRGSTVGGQYNFRTNSITIVSDDPDSLLIDEEILVHEIGHAVQDQQFNLSQYTRATTDEDRGISSLIEGDVSFIENRYLDACEQGLWAEPCVSEDFGSSNGSSGGGSNAPANWGLYFSQFQPYSDGPSFVQSVYQDGGWEAVNARYENPPQSAYYSAFPGTNEDLELANVSVPDRSTDEWERLSFAGTPNYDTVGVAGIFGMFATPTYETQGQFNILRPRDIQNTGPGGQLDSFDPLNYNQSATRGWRGDKLYTYRNDANDAGVVWKLAWESAEAAQPFVDNYQELIEYRNGQRVEGYEYTYTFGEDSEFDMAMTLVPDGDRVTVVTAPTVEDLQAIHQDIELIEASDDQGEESDSNGDTDESDSDGEDGSDGGDETTGGDDSEETNDGDDSDGTDSGEDDGSDDETEGAGDDESEGTSTETDDSDGPGFGVVVAVVAALGVSLLARRD
jgi:PGF-CTERM protein